MQDPDAIIFGMDFRALADALDPLVREAGDLAQAMRREGFVPERKSDGSVVTPADRAVEVMLREKLTALLPGSTVWGEEFGYEKPGPDGLWLVDPIDGTTNYSLGSPLWGVSIALIQGSDLVAGALALPDLGETYLGSKGGGVSCNGKALPAIPEGKVTRSDLVGYCEAVVRMVPREKLPGKQRCAGAFVIEGAFMLQGRLRAMIGVREKLYDMAACALFALELGAEVRYLDGGAMDFAKLANDHKIDRPWIMAPKGSGLGA